MLFRSDPTPAVLLLYYGDPEGLQGVLEQESDGQLGPERTLGDLHDAVVRAYSRRQVILSAALVPATLAG